MVISGYITNVVTKRTAQLLHLDPDMVKLLNELAAESRVPKSVLMREAIDDLLVKHGKLKRPRRKT
jgi:predicted transcriptional regulator